MRELGLHYCSMPQALNHFAAAGKQSLVVTGTHGKTHHLGDAGLGPGRCLAGDPSFMVGRQSSTISIATTRLGNGPHMVFEGDEYDTAYFDKGPQVSPFFPGGCRADQRGVSDHADIFRDLDHVRQAFGRFVGAMAPESTLLAYDADRNIDGLIEYGRCRVQRYGSGADAFWRLGSVAIEPPWTRFTVLRNGAPYGKFNTRMVGEHNLRNALAVIGAADRLNIAAGDIQRATGNLLRGCAAAREGARHAKRHYRYGRFCPSPPRRFGKPSGPSGPFYPAGRLIAVFEPRTNTSMRDVFQDVYPECFDGADRICIRRPPLLSKIPEGERFSSERLVEDLKHRGKRRPLFCGHRGDHRPFWPIRPHPAT